MFYLFVVGQISRLGLLAVLALLMAGIAMVVPVGIGEAIRSQHLAMQVIEALVIADVGLYLAHRAFHAVPCCGAFMRCTTPARRLDWLSPIGSIPSTSRDQGDIAATSVCARLFHRGHRHPVVLQQVHALLVHANTRCSSVRSSG